MFQIIFLSVIGIFYATWLYQRYHRVWKYIARYPGPPTVPIFGNILHLGTSPEDHALNVSYYIRQYNFDPFRMYAGSQPYVFIADAKNVETILSSTKLTQKEDVYKFMRPWLGRGLITSNGDYWVKHRKMITPSFHFQILQDFLHIINETSDRFISFLEPFAQRGKMFDIQEFISRCTLDVLCECAMGYKLNSIEHGKSPMVQAINDLTYIIESRAFSVFKRLDLFFKLTPGYRLQQRSIKLLYDKFKEIIDARRELLPQLTSDKIDKDADFKRPKMALLDNLLTARIDGEPLTHQEIFEEVSTFLFAGYDTTASALTFILYCLSRHPDAQQKAFDEQHAIFGSDVARWPTYTELLEMKYLELVIKETLRLYPSVPLILRTATTHTEIDGLTLPPGTTICIAILTMGANERYFKDPFKFKPERFEADNRYQANPFDYVPFSAGPRNCVGQKFAMMELKCTLSKILRNFVILPAVDGLGTGIHDPCKKCDMSSNPYDVIITVPMTMKSINGVKIRLRKRTY